VLRTPDGDVLAVAAVLPDGQGYLIGQDLPELDDRIYQLWGVSGDQVVSLGSLGGDPTVVAFHGEPDMSGLAITAEDAPVEQSSNPAVVAGTLS
jgi:hypothetical protein